MNTFSELLSLTRKTWKAHENKPATIIASGVPGSGKTQCITTLAVEELIEQGNRPVIVVPNKRAAGAMEKRLTAVMSSHSKYTISQDTPRVLDFKMVVTPHALAYSIIETAVQLQLFSMPRLVTAKEFDNILSQLLTGHLESSGHRLDNPWPSYMETALATPSFVPLLRDFLLRAGESFMSPDDIRKKSRIHGIPIWDSVAAVLEEYQSVNALQSASLSIDQHHVSDFSVSLMNSSEIMEIAVKLLVRHDILQAEIQKKYSHLFIDDAHEFTPDFGQLIQILSRAIPRVLISINRELSPLAWRGAQGNFVDQLPNTYQIHLPHSVRIPQSTAYAINSFSLHSRIESTNEKGAMQLITCTGEDSLEHYMVEQLLYLHQQLGVEWDKIAVIARERSSFHEEFLSRLTLEQIPCINELQPFTLDMSVLAQSCGELISWACSGEITVKTEHLFTGPLFHLTGQQARELANHMQRIAGKNKSSEEYIHCLSVISSWKLPRWSYTNIVRLWEYSNPFSRPEKILELVYAIWENAHCNSPALTSDTLGNTVQTQIKNELLAVNIFLDLFASWIYTGIYSNLLELLDQWTKEYRGKYADICVPVEGKKLTLTSAHASSGREWDYVFVLGLEDKRWPNPRVRTDVLDTQKFLAACALGSNEKIPALDVHEINNREERNLLVLALSRSRHYTYVVAVNDPLDSVPRIPSEFFYELISAGVEHREYTHHAGNGLETNSSLPPLNTEDYVLYLRRTLDTTFQNGAHEEFISACRLLAGCAHYNVISAHPKNWYQGCAPSSQLRLPLVDNTIYLHPSSLDTLATHPLDWFISTVSSSSSEAAIDGNLVHFAHELMTEHPYEYIQQLYLELLPQLLPGPEYVRKKRIHRIMNLVEKVYRTMENRQGTYQLIAVERSLEKTLGFIENSDEKFEVIIQGRIDRMEKHLFGKILSIMDIKTGKYPITVAAAAENLQMRAYRKLLDENYYSMAQFYYPAVKSAQPTVREQKQDPLRSEDIQQYDDFFRILALTSVGPYFEDHRFS